MYLGELEKLIINLFWNIDNADAKEVHNIFKQKRGGTLNTIQSTLDRLFKKGLLAREKESYAFRYTAAKQKKEFIGDLIKDVTKDFTHKNEDDLFAAFVSLSDEFNDDQMAQLETLIQDYKEKKLSDKSMMNKS